MIQRGQNTGEFDQHLSASWLATVAMTLGHAAAEDIAANRLSAEAATTAIEYSILRIVGGSESDAPSTTEPQSTG